MLNYCHFILTAQTANSIVIALPQLIYIIYIPFKPVSNYTGLRPSSWLAALERFHCWAHRGSSGPAQSTPAPQKHPFPSVFLWWMASSWAWLWNDSRRKAMILNQSGLNSSCEDETQPVKAVPAFTHTRMINSQIFRVAINCRPPHLEQLDCILYGYWIFVNQVLRYY